jgi:NAD(P)-dependent dehydrogenase (short-subunit alcohol dehydrogenase family)
MFSAAVADRPFLERVTGIRCDHRLDVEVAAAFERIAHDTEGIDILVNNVWGGYERMLEDGAFTWGCSAQEFARTTTRVSWRRELWSLGGAG